MRPRGNSEARIGRGQRAALSISPAGGLGTDARRARGSGGGHRSAAARTRARPEPNRDPLTSPTSVEFPDSLVAYILELFGRTEPGTPQAVGRDSRERANASDGGPQTDTGTAVAERRDREEDDMIGESDLSSLPDLLSPRPRSDAVIWFNEPLAELGARNVVEVSIPDTNVPTGDNASPNQAVLQPGPMRHAADASQARPTHSEGNAEEGAGAARRAEQSARPATGVTQQVDQDLGAPQHDREQEGAGASAAPATGTPVQRLLRVFFRGS